MGAGYAMAYRLGITPWERAGSAGAAQLSSLLDQEEQGLTPPFGHALDVGCGSGTHSVELARRGWQVTGVDAVPRALERARGRAADAGVDVRFLQDDVTRLSDAVGDGFRLFLDVGCFHGFRPDERAAVGRAITAHAAPEATLLMMGFQPGLPRPLPRGVTRQDIEDAFPGWLVKDEVPAELAGMPRPLRKAAPRWTILRRVAA